MTTPVKLRIYVNEPWDFEQVAGSAELLGWTIDHEDMTNRAWIVELDQPIEFHDQPVSRLLIEPHYVGERLSRMFDMIMGFPVRIAYRREGEWQFAFAGMVSKRTDPADEQENKASN